MVIIWSSSVQLILNATGILTTASISINALSQFEIQSSISPILLGQDIYFCNAKSDYSTLSKYTLQQTTETSLSVSIEEITSHVPTYIPNFIHSISGSTTENFFGLLSTGDSKKLFIYKYNNSVEKQQSWSHWEFGTDNKMDILSIKFLHPFLFVVIHTGTEHVIGYINFSNKNIMQKDHIDFIRKVAVRDIKQDSKITINYNTDTLDITFKDIYPSLGVTVFPRNNKFIAITESGSMYDVTPKKWTKDTIISIPFINLKDKDNFILTFGFIYEFKYVFSKFFIRTFTPDGRLVVDNTGRLQLQRAWLNFARSGPFEVQTETLQAKYIQESNIEFLQYNADYIKGGFLIGNSYLLVNKKNVGSGQCKFPIYGDSQSITVSIISTNPTPLSILNVGWVGKRLKRLSMV